MITRSTLFTKLGRWLASPFPFYETYRQKFLIAFLFGLFIIFFLVAFNPSHNTDFVQEQFLKVIVYGFITFFIISLYNVGIPLLFPKVFDSEKWNIKKTITFLLLTVISIGLLNGLFGFYFDNPDNNGNIFLFLFFVIIKTLTIAVLPTIIFVFYFEKILYKKHSLLALETLEKINKSRNRQPDNFEKVIIISPDTKTKLELACNDLFCVKAEENYCTCYFNKDNHVSKTMIRLSLKQVEQAFSHSENIIRCHKSYIVNLDKVNDMTGNARGYFFTIDQLDFKIPGSRNLPKEVISMFPFIT
jgi:hypothetical protein